MATFTRTTFFEACNVLGSGGHFRTHLEFEKLMYRWELDDLAEHRGVVSIDNRCIQLFRHLKNNLDAKHDGRFVIDLVVEEAARLSGAWAPEGFLRALKRDGFILEDGNLRRALPEVLDLPAADDEVHALLDRYGLTTTSEHLDQGIKNHSGGTWAAANSQFRTFLESLFDEIALLVDPTAGGTKAGETRRQLLANYTPPFLSRELNEWSDDGKNFVNGTFKRLHPQGSHPGLSDEEDSTFRLHLVLLTARLFLRRLDSTVNSTVKGSE